MAAHMWEDWNAETKERMAEQMLLHGAARARLVVAGLEKTNNEVR